MAINITVDNSKISDNSSVLGRATIEGTKDTDLTIKLKELEVNGQATVLDDLKVKVMEELKHEASSMDKNSVEYKEIQEFLEKKQWNKSHIINHLKSFSEGVLASIIANYLTSGHF